MRNKTLKLRLFVHHSFVFLGAVLKHFFKNYRSEFKKKKRFKILLLEKTTHSNVLVSDINSRAKELVFATNFSMQWTLTFSKRH